MVSVWMVLLLIGAAIGSRVPIRYMMNSCKSRVFVNTSLLLEVTREFAEDRVDIDFTHCAVELVADPSRKLFLHFEAIDIADDGSTPDRLHIFDYNDDGKRVRVTAPRGIYGAYEFPYYTSNTAGIPVRDYRSSSNRLTVDYFGKPTVMYHGFRILLTVYRPTNQHGGCSGREMECRNEHICIHPTLKCDGLANCGAHDGSDEYNCAGRAEATTDLLESYSVMHAVVAAIVSCVIFLLVVTVVVCWIKKFKKKHGYKPKNPVRYTINGAGRSSPGDLARLYAPPSYESVVLDADEDLGPPPDYSMVAAGGLDITGQSQARKPTELRPSYSSVEVAILHEEPRLRDTGSGDTESNCTSHDENEQCDSTSREVTSDYVSRDSMSECESTEKPDVDMKKKTVVRSVDL